MAIEEIMGYPDDLKLKSSMTLFARAADIDLPKPAKNAIFTELLETFFGGESDPLTLARL